MPRLRYITESEKTPVAKELITSAEAKGAPDPRVVSIMTRNPKAGVAWVKSVSYTHLTLPTIYSV